MKSVRQRKFKALALGGIIAIVVVLVLARAGLMIVDPAYVSPPIYLAINVLGFLFCWLAISFLTHKFPIYRVVGVVGLLIVAAIADIYLKIPDNPITIPFLILFWLGAASLIAPQFFKKYQVAILAVYGAVLSYFFVFRMMPDYATDHRQTFNNFLLTPIPVFVGLWFYEHWRWLKTLEADKAKAELTLLKNQINPHFFFNTLNNLYGLAVEKSEQAPAMILKLSDIMRYTIYDAKAEYVPLENEVTYLEDYIALHRIRYHQKVDIALYKDLQHPHTIAPLLLIVPLENAFKHGVERLAERAFINISIKTTPTDLIFVISNNYEASATERQGIGLTNLKKRLALIYPNRHQLEITKTADSYTLRLEINSYELPDHRRRTHRAPYHRRLLRRTASPTENR
jgi:hypothetical protein